MNVLLTLLVDCVWSAGGSSRTAPCTHRGDAPLYLCSPLPNPRQRAAHFYFDRKCGAAGSSFVATMRTNMLASSQSMYAFGALRFVELVCLLESVLLFGNGCEAKSLTSSPGESSGSGIIKLRRRGVCVGWKRGSQCWPQHAFSH